jgi:hypothetical protein
VDKAGGHESHGGHAGADDEGDVERLEHRSARSRVKDVVPTRD